jgi:hypothetical protein
MAKIRRPTISLAPYTLKVKDQEQRSWAPVNDFSDSEDLLSFLKSLLGGLKSGPHKNDAVTQILRVKELQTESRTLSGVLETGEYGSESDIFDVMKLKLAHKRTTNEADMLPFYFLIHVPEGPDEAILILEHRGNTGVKDIFYSYIRHKFAEAFPGFELKIGGLMDEKELEKYLDGPIDTVRFITFKIPKDICDAIGRGHREQGGKVELVVKSKRGTSLPVNKFLKAFLGGDTQLNQLISLNLFEYENIKMETKRGQARRTIDLGRDIHIRSFHDITSQVTLDANTNRPEFDSIHGLATTHLKKLSAQLYKKNGQ